MIVQYNQRQSVVLINSSNRFIGLINRKLNTIESYLSLRSENERLLQENVKLRNLLPDNYKPNRLPQTYVNDSNLSQIYQYIGCKIIHSSTHKSRNFLTVDAGSLQGVTIGNAVISSEGVVGVVKTVSKHYASVMPVINADFKVSCRLNHDDYYGSLVWDGISSRGGFLNDIPFHVKVAVGDSLFTTGYSNIFPSGIPVGTVKKVSSEGGDNFYTIAVDLVVDYKKIQSVMVVNQLLKSDMDSLSVEIDD